MYSSTKRACLGVSIIQLTWCSAVETEILVDVQPPRLADQSLRFTTLIPQEHTIAGLYGCFRGLKIAGLHCGREGSLARTHGGC